MATTLSAQDIKGVKAKGFLWNRGTDNFSARVITGNGVMTSDEMSHIAEAARLFGNGTATLTARLTVECPGISYENIPKFTEFLSEKGLIVGGTGAKIRPVVSCKGTTCIFGNADTQGIAARIHEKFFIGWHDVALPHKFKIAVGGCPNNCIKPDLNDFGIIGKRKPGFKEEQCRGCKKCQIVVSCPMSAAEVRDGKLYRDDDICNFCGRCVTKCPFHACDEETPGLAIVIGGRWGKKVRQGSMLNGLFTEDEAMAVLERTILFFKESGIKGERLSDTVDRIGFDLVEKTLLSSDIMERKEQILNG